MKDRAAIQAASASPQSAESATSGHVPPSVVEPSRSKTKGMGVTGLTFPRFFTEAGIDPEAYSFRDGSGLARLNLVTPSTVVKLLRYMYVSPQRDNWISLLPVGGEDGTLSTRFGETAAAGRVHAKTGSTMGGGLGSRTGQVR